MTYKETLQEELRTFKKVLLGNFTNLKIKELSEEIILFYEEAIKREERIEEYDRRYVKRDKPDTRPALQYP